jgi:acetyl esterase/lipase
MKSHSPQSLLLLALLFGITPLLRAGVPTAPAQPATGPGGMTYSHAGVTKSVHGEGSTQYWLFEPAEPVLKSAPVIVFLHGWSQMNPRSYGAWVEHLVRRGNIVIFPRYQADLLTPGKAFTDAVIVSVRDALAELGRPGHIAPDLGRFAVVGHSCGALQAANLSALAADEKLPRPRAVMVIQPGKHTFFPLANLAQIPAETLLFVASGDEDDIAGDVDARLVFAGATRVKEENKRYLAYRSDDHGRPRAIMHHATPLALDMAYEAREIDGTGPAAWREATPRRAAVTAPVPRGNKATIDGRTYLISSWERPPNFVDYYAYWRPFDALCDAAFSGKHAGDAIAACRVNGGFMGQWSDGVPVKVPVIVSKLATEGESAAGERR